MSEVFSIQLPSVEPPRSPGKTLITKAPSAPAEKSFGQTLSSFVKDINDVSGQADKAIEDVVTGRTEHLHEAVIAVNKADLSFRYMMEIRSKLLQAYQEIQRLQM